MQHFFKTLAFCLLVATGLQAQSTLQYIPGDVTFNLSVRPASLDAKMDFEKIKQLGIFQMITQGMIGGMGSGSPMDDLLSDPSAMGVDLMQESCLFASLQADRQAFGYLMAMSDAGKFEGLLQQFFGGAFEVMQADGYRYVSLDSDFQLAWNQDVLLLAAVEVSDPDPPLFDFDWEEDWEMEDMEEIEEVPEYLEEAPPPPPPPAPYEEIEEEQLEEEDLVIEEPPVISDDYYPYEDDYSYEERQQRRAEYMGDWVGSVMNRSSGQGLAQQARYRKAAGKPADLHFWANYAQLMNMSASDMGGMGMGMGGNPLAAMMPLMMSMYDDTFLSAGLNFNKGEMRLDMDLYSNERLLKIWRGSLDAKFNKKIAKYIDGEHLLGYFNVQYNVEETMEGLRELMDPMLESIPMYGEMAQALIDVIGIAIDEDALYNLFKGDLTLAFTGLQEVERTITTYEYDDDFNAQEIEKTVTQTVPEMAMMMSYGSQENINRLLRLGTSSSFLVPEGNYYRIAVPDMPMDIYLALADDILFVTNNVDLVQNRLGSGYAKKDRLSKEHCKRLQKSASVFFWDIPASMDAALAFGLPIDEGPGMMVFEQLKQELDYMLIQAPKEVDDSVSSSMIFSIQDDQVNILEKILNLANDLAAKQMGGNSRS
ncbi:MAG: DUF4836 family protein [Saprospiraceae bacterium]|nr:DUF4836 family protein [Saprospiraceae bacterium]MCB0680947.1 DUF4836 family protein [Saprospiraceae bacterium]